MHSDTSLSGAACTSGITSNKLVQSSSENDSGGNYFSGSAKISTFGSIEELSGCHFQKTIAQNIRSELHPRIHIWLTVG